METLYLTGVIIGGFLSFVLFTRSDKTVADYMLACWLATSAIMLLSVYLLTSGQFIKYPTAAIQGLWMPLAQGPFLYLYIKYQTRPLRFKKQEKMASIKKGASKITSFGSIPLCVISATDEDRFDPFIKDKELKAEMVAAWNKMQKDLLLLSPVSRQVLVPNSSHYINQDQPKVIEDAVKEMIPSIRFY